MPPTLYALGSNGSGQLSLSHKEDVSLPTKCTFDTPPPPDDDEIVRIVAGGNHTLLLMASGVVYAAGWNGDGRCGPRVAGLGGSKVQDGHGDGDEDGGDGKGCNEDEILRFRRVVVTDTQAGCGVEKFRLVSATWEGSILVASMRRSTPAGEEEEAEDYEDSVFVLGSSPKGELGLGGDCISPVSPGTKIPSFPPRDTRVTALSSGMGHSVAVLSNGDVYGWGGARKGQLGGALKDRGEKIVWVPEKIEGVPFFVKGAGCGREFTVVWGEKERGEVMVLGEKRNRWGVMDVPGEIKGGRRFGDVGASWHGVYVHVPALPSPSNGGERGDLSGAGAGPDAAPGSVIAWGRNDRGQLPPPDLPPVVQLAVGSEHVLALLEDGSVAAFGWGEHGNCGPDTDSMGNVSGSYKLIELPEDVRAAGERVVGVGAGCATSWLIVK